MKTDTALTLKKYAVYAVVLSENFDYQYIMDNFPEEITGPVRHMSYCMTNVYLGISWLARMQFPKDTGSISMATKKRSIREPDSEHEFGIRNVRMESRGHVDDAMVSIYSVGYGTGDPKADMEWEAEIETMVLLQVFPKGHRYERIWLQGRIACP